MRKVVLIVILLIVAGTAMKCGYIPQKPETVKNEQVGESRKLPEGCIHAQVFFSPRGGVQDAIIAELDKAKVSVLVQAYSFTNASIAKALLEAKKRGVSVTIILDKSNRHDQYTAADFTRNSGIPTFIDGKHKIAHNKVIILDSQTVITGSYNFSRSAEESNAENIIILQSAEIAKSYIGNWDAHKSHSEEYEGK
jgi:phosphatidylserine/phosphatidylglycerophosphate/cardiolipin synthase-like enzyme